MLTKLRAGLAAVAVAGAMLVPIAAASTAQAATHSRHCAPHTTGQCKANSPHPRFATAKCWDGTYSYSEHFRGTCSHHKGVRYWYK